jgi:hypothetical protein
VRTKCETTARGWICSRKDEVRGDCEKVVRFS